MVTYEPERPNSQACGSEGECLPPVLEAEVPFLTLLPGKWGVCVAGRVREDESESESLLCAVGRVGPWPTQSKSTAAAFLTTVVMNPLLGPDCSICPCVTEEGDGLQRFSDIPWISQRGWHTQTQPTECISNRP